MCLGLASLFVRQFGHAILEPPCHDKEALLLGYNTRNKTLIVLGYVVIPIVQMMQAGAWSLTVFRALIAPIALNWFLWTLLVVLGRVTYLVWKHDFRISMIWFIKLITDPLTDILAYFPPGRSAPDTALPSQDKTLSSEAMGSFSVLRRYWPGAPLLLVDLARSRSFLCAVRPSRSGVDRQAGRSLSAFFLALRSCNARCFWLVLHLWPRIALAAHGSVAVPCARAALGRRSNPQPRRILSLRQGRGILRQQVGLRISWLRKFPFSCLKHPQYLGALLSIWGFLGDALPPRRLVLYRRSKPFITFSARTRSNNWKPARPCSMGTDAALAFGFDLPGLQASTNPMRAQKGEHSICAVLGGLSARGIRRRLQAWEIEAESKRCVGTIEQGRAGFQLLLPRGG